MESANPYTQTERVFRGVSHRFPCLLSEGSGQVQESNAYQLQGVAKQRSGQIIQKDFRKNEMFPESSKEDISMLLKGKVFFSHCQAIPPLLRASGPV